MSHARIKLSQVVDAMELPEELSAYFDRRTGQVETISEEDVSAAENDEGAESAPDWQHDAIEAARAIEADTEDRFLPLPDRFDADEWRMMAGFAASLDDETARGELDRAIRGKGAFRYFKDKVHDLDLADQWHAYRDECYRTLAVEWCEANGLECEV